MPTRPSEPFVTATLHDALKLTLRGVLPWIRKGRKRHRLRISKRHPKTANCVAGHIAQRACRPLSDSHCWGNGASHEHDEPWHNRRPFEPLAALE